MAATSCLSRLFIVLALAGWGLAGSSARGAVITYSQQMTATQNVNLLGVNATLVATGPVDFTFDVDANNNSIPGGTSTMDAMFFGFLPSEFGALGVAGAPFELFSIDPEVITVTGNGTHVKAETTFGLRLFVAPNVVGANFFTAVNSVFESDVVSLQDFTGAVFQDPNRPDDATFIFIGDNLLDLDPGMLVGVSFNRTVAPVPEPTSLAIFASATAMGLLYRGTRRKTPAIG